MKSEKGSRKDANNGNFGVIGKGPQSKRERMKEARGCAEGSGERGSLRRNGNWGEKVHLGKSGVCVCGLLGVPRHGDPRAVSCSPTARAEGTR